MPSTFDETALGGVVASGSSLYLIASRRTASGGVVSSGVAVRSLYAFNVASGGTIAGGSSRSGVFIRGHGGVVSGGLSEVSTGYVASGGVVVQGVAKQTFFDYVSGSGGVIARGSSVNNQKKFYRTQATGGIVVGSSVSYGIASRRYNPDGGILMSGTSAQNMVFYFDSTFKWNINSRIYNDITFLWNTGLLINYWYRVMGRDKCTHDPCCQRYIVNVHAKSPSELCDKLIKRRYKFSIESVQQFLMPANNSQVKILEDQGQNFDDCNKWIPIPLCELSLCEDFCINFDLQENMSFDIIFTQVDANFNHEASEGAYITGSAIAYCDRLLPSYSYEAEGGIVLDGEVSTTSSGFRYTSSGGILMGGTSHYRSTSWHFTGGQWPNTSRVRFAEKTESLAELATDQIWSLTDRVIKDDSLFSSTDISYGRTSQFLIVRGFDFDVPEDSNILHVYVTVSRKASQLHIRDLEAYILNGDDIISENKANIFDWPYLIESQTVYDFTDAFDVEDINDYEIGFALRVKSLTGVASAIASVDNITLEVIYENSLNQKVRVSGAADIVSSAYSWVASGGVQLESSCVSKLGFKYKTTGTGIVMGGKYGLNLSYEASGGITIGGNSNARPSFQEITASGGMIAGGEAVAKPYFEYGYGGMMIGSTAVVKNVYKNRGTGGCIATGKVISPSSGIYSAIADGGITMGGNAGRKIQNWTYHSSGNIVFILGEAGCHSSDIGDFIEDTTFDMTVDAMLVEFDADEDLHNAKGVVEMLSRCGCGDIPLTINLEHRIAKDNNFAKFLARNSLKISNRLTMQYNVPNDSWQSNLHYTGLSADANTRESWDVVFDIQCTQNLGGIFIGHQIWRLGMEVVRKNLNNGFTSSTRAVIGVLPDQICAANELRFKATLDTQTGGSEITPVGTIYQSVLYDDIGMFKNSAWILSPNLIFTVSQSGLDVVQNRIDLTSDVLVS